MTSLRDQIRALGADFTLEQAKTTRELYAPHAPAASPDVCTVERDIQYGPAPKQRLDVFAPSNGDGPDGEGSGGRPVVMFVHGGGFVAGDKGGADAPFYNNIGVWAARAGFVGVTMTYRLAPASVWPSGAEDVAAAVAWLKANAARYGGDPGRVIVWGQSAGASHVASYLAHPDFRDAASSVGGAILCSGVYDIARAERNEFNAAYFGEDPAAWEAMSSLEGLAETSVPLLLTVSELEPAQFQHQAAWAVERIVAVKERWPAFLWLWGHNHVSPVVQVGAEMDDLGPRLAPLIADPARWT